MNLYNQFIKAVEQYPDHLCISDAEQSLTYQQTLDKVNSYIEQIKKLNIAKHSSAIIYLPKSNDIIIWQLAFNACEIAFLTLEYNQESRLFAAIKKCRPSCIISPGYSIEKSLVNNPIIYQDCAYIVFSSGSTGEPKQILLKDSPVIEVVLEQANITQMNSNQTFLWLLNPAFDASLSDIYMTILSGGHLVISDLKPTEIKKITTLINQYNVTHTDIPPVVLNIWLKYIEQNKLPSLKHIVFGGEKGNENTLMALSKYCSLYNAYGPTETTICSSMSKVDDNWNSNNIGTPFNGVFYKIIDNELHIGGQHCAIGYDNETLNKKFYIENDIKWFMSGDLVEFKNDTFFYIGRKDRQFKHYGQLISPEEIEAVALKCGATMVRVKYEDNKIILKYSGELKQENLINYLPQWMIPHTFEQVELNVNNNWKVIE